MIYIILINLFCLMTTAWLIYLLLKNASVIDCFWPLAFMLTSCFYLSGNVSTTGTVLLAVIVIWSLRLFLYLLSTRLIPRHIEQRYGAPETTGIAYLWLNFQFQGLLVFLLTLPLYWVYLTPSFSLSHPLLLAITALQLLAILAETVADLQLYEFRKQSKSLVCETGFWYYSRHPNLFFDWLFWLLVSIEVSFVTPFAAITPILLYVIMNHLTVPITEKQSLKRKGKAFSDNQDSTSRFFIWFKRSS